MPDLPLRAWLPGTRPPRRRAQARPEGLRQSSVDFLGQPRKTDVPVHMLKEAVRVDLQDEPAAVTVPDQVGAAEGVEQPRGRQGLARQPLGLRGRGARVFITGALRV